MLYHLNRRLRTYRCSCCATISRHFSIFASRRSNGEINSAELPPAVLHPFFPNEGHHSSTRGWQEDVESDREYGGSIADVPTSAITGKGVAIDESIDTGYNQSFQAPARPRFKDSGREGQFSPGNAAVYNSIRGQSLLRGSNLSSNALRSAQGTKVENIQNAHKKITEAFENENASLLLDTIWGLSRDQSFIATVPSTTFIEILRRLDPYDDFLPFRHGYAERIPKHYHMLKGQTQNAMEILSHRRTMYQDICYNRFRHGRELDVKENAQLLKCARGTWDGRFASKVMMEMISKKRQPDLDCYNYYFEAKCWSDAWHPNERQSLRVFPYAIARRQRMAKHELSGGMTIHPHTVGQKGLKSEVTKVFTHMIEGGIMADGKAFGHLITALAREGDMQGVKAIMKKVWDVDVDSMNTRKNGKSTAVPRSSPLYPDQDLLFVLAHAFGSNNDVSTALRVVDQFSRIFSISIPTNVWAELLEWSFTLSTRRYKRRKEDGAQLGQLDIQTPENLWNVLTSEPYNCEPTLPMYDVMIRSLRRRDHLFPTLEYIVKGLDLHNHNVKQCQDQAHEEKIENAVHDENFSLESRKQRFISFVTVSRWFSLLLSGQRWLSNANQSRVLFWQRQLLPDVVGIFWRYREQKGVKYVIETGIVCLQE